MNFLINNETPIKLLPNNEKAAFNFVVIKKIKDLLNNYKKKLDPYNDARGKERFSIIRNTLDDFYLIKKNLMRRLNEKFISNAYIKMYEMLTDYPLIAPGTKTLKTFHNAEFPGSFIMGMKKYISINHSDIAWTWYGSSFLDGPLKDDYGLYKSHPERWVMRDTPERNGDVTNILFLNYLKKNFGNSIDIYTSDLGFHISDYNNQETIHAKANLGQILSGLLVLKKGGAFINKQYTLFEDFSISLVVLLSSLFKEFRIIKPASSRTMNSETYFLGMGFLGMSDEIETHLFARIKNFSLQPLVTRDSISNVTYKQIRNANLQLAIAQAKKIVHFVYLEKKYKNVNDAKKLFATIMENEFPEKQSRSQSYDLIK